MASIVKQQNATNWTDQLDRWPDIEKRAAAILQAAEREAAAILQQSRDEAAKQCQRIEEQTRKAVTEQVRRQYEDELRERQQSWEPAVREALEHLHQQGAARQEIWETRLVQLACRIASRVVRDELQHSPDIPLRLVRQAMDMLPHQPLRLSMHAEDVQHLGEPLRALLRESDSNVELVADPRVERGGCRLENAHSSVDMQFSTQLRRFEEELLT